MKPTYLTFSQLAYELGYGGKRPGDHCREWWDTTGYPKFRRGRVWLVRWSDAQAAIEGRKPKQQKGAAS